MMELWKNLYLLVCEVLYECYSYLALNIFNDDVDYDYFYVDYD